VSSAWAEPPRVVYRSPVAGARYERPETGLILRFDQRVNASVLPAFTVTGSTSGPHAGRTRLSDDGRTVLFQPDTRFAWGEKVSVSVTSRTEASVPDLSFTIASPPSRPMLRSAVEDGDPLSAPAAVSPAFLAPQGAADSLPASFPPIQSTIYQTPAPGMLFLASFSAAPNITPYLMIIDDNGTPLFYRAMSAACFDFKRQPNGLLTYYDSGKLKYYEMDSTYTVVDSFQCGNGLLTDEHELRLLPNGHALLMSYDGQDVDMSEFVDGGDPDAQVVGCVIQELDENKNVVFEWRSWDHFQITDATHENLQAEYIDYVHANALEVDFDGNILLSSRHMDEITKIDRQTGDIIWRWGGKNNEFNFQGDTLQFSHQHAIRRLDNGHYVLFDNGNYHSTPYSRAVEYDLNQHSLTARNVWQYRNTPDTYGFAMGYVQRLANGNTLITWGTGKPNLIEVDPAGNKVMEMALPVNVFSYRALRQDWLPQTTSATSGPSAFSLTANAPNPFRGQTAFYVKVSHATPVTVHVFDTRGREVQNVTPEVSQVAGAYRVRVDLTGRASGVYLAQVSTPEGMLSRRLVHIQ